jgi:hypothetical protein
MCSHAGSKLLGAIVQGMHHQQDVQYWLWEEQEGNIS